MSSLSHHWYRFKYRFGSRLPLSSPVDVSLELASHCNMGCEYCVDPETPVLTSSLQWKSIKDLAIGEKIVAFDENSGPDNKNRELKSAVVEDMWEVSKEAFRINTTHGEITCSLDHKFLNHLGRWVETRSLELGDEILFSKAPWESYERSRDYIRGYLDGIGAGDGTARWEPLAGSTGRADDPRRQIWWRVALKDNEPLQRICEYFDALGIEHPGIKPFSAAQGNYAAISKVEIRSKASIDRLKNALEETGLDFEGFAKGYLAGIFDSEGSYSQQGVLRISQLQENDVCDRTMKYMSHFGFESVREATGVRMLGGVWEAIRFFGMVQPTIQRKISGWSGFGVRHQKARIIGIVPLGTRKLIDLQTSTRTFYGAGFATHNCYHAEKDKEKLPFVKGFMPLWIAKRILSQAADLEVPAIKLNWKGESTLNPHFAEICEFARSLAKGSTFQERITNSNFKFPTERIDIFQGLMCQTKVKVSMDSFDPEVFEKQRAGGIHALTVANIDFLHNLIEANLEDYADKYEGHKPPELVIQAVRTKLNECEDIGGRVRLRWPLATVSIRDMVGGRINRDLGDLEAKSRDPSQRQSCLQAHVRLIFNWQGKAFPCCPDIGEKLCLGDITQERIETIFNGESARILRDMLKSKNAFLNEPCRGCSSFETFKGYKPAWNS